MERRNERYAELNKKNYYLGDNLARTLDNPDKHRMMRDRRRQIERQRARKAAERKEKIIRFVAVGAASAIVICFCVMLLSTISRNNELTGQINLLEYQIEDLRVLNDAKEYDIDASVDLEYVIQVATQELGMVRSSSSQIITYETQNSEYVQQLAEIPTE